MTSAMQNEEDGNVDDSGSSALSEDQLLAMSCAGNSCSVMTQNVSVLCVPQNQSSLAAKRDSLLTAKVDS